MKLLFYVDDKFGYYMFSSIEEYRQQFFFFFFFFFTVLELKHHEMKRYGSLIKNRSRCVKMVLPLREDGDTEESVLIRCKRDKKNKRPGRGLT